MVERYVKIFDGTNSGEKELLLKANVAMLKIEVIGSGSLSLMAMLDRDSNKQVLGAIKSDTFASTIALTAGLYTVEVSGYYKVFFTLSGNATVNVKTIC